MPDAARKFVIRSEGYARYGVPGGASGQFLEWFDPTKDGPAGEEMGGFTPDPLKAKTFDSAAEAWTFWRQPRINAQNVPYHRADGLLDRPLTAFNVSVIPLDEVINKTKTGETDHDGKDAPDAHPRRSAAEAADHAEIDRILAPLRRSLIGPGFDRGSGEGDQD